MSPAKTAKRRDAVSAISSYLLIVMAVGWLVMTALRETPIFWRNAGGYPVGLRMFVLDFYPIITTGLLLTGTRRTWEFFQSDRHSRVQVSLTLCFWCF